MLMLSHRWLKASKGRSSLCRSVCLGCLLLLSTLAVLNRTQPVQGKRSGLTVLFFHCFWPDLTYGSDVRLLRILNVTQALGHVVHFASRKSGSSSSKAALRSVVGDSFTVVGSPSRLRRLARIVPDVSVIVLPVWFWEGNEPNVFEQFSPALRRQWPHAVIVAISDDCNHVRERMLSAALPPEERPETYYGSGVLSESILRKREAAIFAASHVVTFITADDAELCSALIPTTTTALLLRVGSSDAPLPSTSQPLNDPPSLVFVGNGNNPTNYLGMRYFLTDIWPVLRRQLPTLTLHLVGTDTRALPPCVQHGHLCGWTWKTQYTGREAQNGIIITGFLPSLSEMHRHLAMIVPINVTTGVNTKVLTGLQHGLPIIGTRRSLRAMALEDRPCTTLCELDSPLCWAKAVQALAHEETRSVMARASLAESHRLFVEDNELKDTKALFQIAGRLLAMAQSEGP